VIDVVAAPAPKAAKDSKQPKESIDASLLIHVFCPATDVYIV